MDPHELALRQALLQLLQRVVDQELLALGALVNMSAIESYGAEDGVLVLRLKDGTRVEASERRAAEVRRKLR